MYGTPTYRSWRAMKQRCLCKNHVAYLRYGGNGIEICKSWDKFENFLHDMGKRPSNKTLDRINRDKGYYKSNCRWSTKSEQQKNRRPHDDQWKENIRNGNRLWWKKNKNTPMAIRALTALRK